MKRLLVGLTVFVFLAAHAVAEQPLYPQRTAVERGKTLRTDPWIETLEREVPPLKNRPPADRLPMIMWHGVGFQPLSLQQLGVLRDRGLTQHLQLDESMIPAALALQKAGMKVILMQGRTDNWPYSLAEKPDDWSHQLDLSYQPDWFGKEDAFEWFGACPHKTDGWKVLQRQTLKTVKAFRDAGVNLDGVWMDFEGDPYPWSHLFEQLQHCKRCRAELPANIINDKEAWRDDAWQRYVRLYDQHFAKPIREVYPDCLVTNWHVVFSTQANPVRYFVREVNLPALSPQYFNATNPIAYGCDLTWQSRNTSHLEESASSVDEFYREEILQQVRTDRANREMLGKRNTGQHNDKQTGKQTGARSVPWVARYCKLDPQNRKSPMMTRGAYGSALDQLWKEEIATMQIFNTMHEGYEEYALMEVQDAARAYDRSLE